MTEEANIQVQFTHSVKISDTARGIRIDVHVWANSQTDAVIEAFSTYQDCQNLAKARGIQLAPVEVVAK